MKIRRIRRSLEEMKIAKAKYHGAETFNDYDVELSWGQLQAIYRALEQNHSDPIADETFAELGYYLANTPGPGESEEAYKEAAQAGKEAEQLGEEPGMEEEPRDMEGIGSELEGPEVGEEHEGAEPPIEGEGGGFEPEGGEERAGVDIGELERSAPPNPTGRMGTNRYSPARGNVGAGNFESRGVLKQANVLLEAPPRS